MEVFGESRDGFPAFAQRRAFDGEGAQAVEYVLPETIGFDVGFEVAIGRGDDAHIHLPRSCVADALDFLLLQHAQQFGLHGGTTDMSHCLFCFRLVPKLPLGHE